GVTGFGLFVQIDDLFIYGIVHIAHLGQDYYRHDDKLQRLEGEKTGQHFRLGDKVQVQVAAVHVEDRKIDLMLVADDKAEETAAGVGNKESRWQELEARKILATKKKDSPRGGRGRPIRKGK